MFKNFWLYVSNTLLNALKSHLARNDGAYIGELGRKGILKKDSVSYLNRTIEFA